MTLRVKGHELLCLTSKSMRKKLTSVNDKTKPPKRENRRDEVDSHNVLLTRIFIMALYIVNRVRGAKGQTPRYEVEG